MYQVVFYRNERGEEPVVSFLETLAWKTRRKIEAWIALLEAEGPNLKRPYADKLAGELYELRIRFGADQIRILYFFFLREKIVLLHGFRKKQRAIETGHISIAQSRMTDVMRRYHEGQIE